MKAQEMDPAEVLPCRCREPRTVQAPTRNARLLRRVTFPESEGKQPKQNHGELGDNKDQQPEGGGLGEAIGMQPISNPAKSPGSTSAAGGSKKPLTPLKTIWRKPRRGPPGIPPSSSRPASSPYLHGWELPSLHRANARPPPWPSR